MNKRLFTGLALAVALLIGGPAFGHDDKKGKDDGRDYGAYRGGGGGGSVAAFSSRGASGFRGGTFAAGRSFRSAPSVAFGGSSFNSRAFANRRGGNGRFAFNSHQGWSRGRDYDWNGRHYRWYNNGWFIVDPYYSDYPDYESYDSYQPAYTVYGSSDDQGTGPVSAQVQSALAQQGYYRGPIDGIIGPVTESAIAAYQRNNGLQVTGAINGGLLDSLGLD
jgi:hypothetical protein